MKRILLIVVLLTLFSCDTQVEEKWDNQFVFYKMSDPETLLINDKLTLEGAVESTNTTESNYHIITNETDGTVHLSFYREASYDSLYTDMYNVSNISEELPWVDKDDNLKTLTIPPDRLNEPIYDGYYYFMVSNNRWD